MKVVYFISGLGADKRAFESLDLSFCKPVFLDWLVPEPDETIEHYASRMKAKIITGNPVIVGLSFGGIMAMELAKHIQFDQIILISSAKNFREIPPYFRVLKLVPIHRLVPATAIKKLNAFAYRLMGIQKREDKVKFMKMFQEADDRYVSWAIDKIINWRNTSVPSQTTHIHGTFDILLPHFFIRANYPVQGGKHLMPMTQPELISNLLKKIIA